MSQNASIPALLRELNSDDTQVAEEAQHSLQELGRPTLEPVLGALSGLGVFGQRCALDLLTSWPPALLQEAGGLSVETAVVPLLASEDAVVREWAADTLCHADARNALPSLRSALDRAKEAGVRPDWTEAVSLRRALTVLGDRQEVLPGLLAYSMKQDEKLERYWPASSLGELIESLAGEKQVLLYHQAWQPHRDSFLWLDSPSFDLDMTGLWDQVVERARFAALQAIEKWDVPKEVVVTLEWIGERDR